MKPVDDEHPILESQFCFLQEIFTNINLTENISLSFHRMFKVTVTYPCPQSPPGPEALQPIIQEKAKAKGDFHS